MRQQLIIGNWKMNKDANATCSFFEEFNSKSKQINIKDNLIYGIAVPYINLSLAAILIKDRMVLASQDISDFNDYGAHTGDINGLMLKSFNVSFAIVGHSERRKYYNETNRIVNQKAKVALNNNITPIICVGETLEQYEANQSKEVIRTQLLESINGLNPERIIIAYEPIWAIGTGKSATIEYAQSMCNFIRSLTSENTIIQYGGSVTPENINQLLIQPDIDGALVGGASLKVDSFIDLIKK